MWRCAGETTANMNAEISRFYLLSSSLYLSYPLSFSVSEQDHNTGDKTSFPYLCALCLEPLVPREPWQMQRSDTSCLLLLYSGPLVPQVASRNSQARVKWAGFKAVVLVDPPVLNCIAPVSVSVSKTTTNARAQIWSLFKVRTGTLAWTDVKVTSAFQRYAITRGLIQVDHWSAFCGSVEGGCSISCRREVLRDKFLGEIFWEGQYLPWRDGGGVCCHPCCQLLGSSLQGNSYIFTAMHASAKWKMRRTFYLCSKFPMRVGTMTSLQWRLSRWKTSSWTGEPLPLNFIA